MIEAKEPTLPADLILHQTEDGKTRIQCRLEQDKLWLSQVQRGDPYHKDVTTINEELINLFDEKELEQCSTFRQCSASPGNRKGGKAVR